MTTEEREHLISELRDIANRLPLWGFVTVDFESIKAVLSEVDRLTRENAELKTKIEPGFFERLLSTISSQAHRSVVAQSHVWRLQKRVNTLLDASRDGGVLGRDDLKREVIE